WPATDAAVRRHLEGVVQPGPRNRDQTHGAETAARSLTWLPSCAEGVPLRASLLRDGEDLAGEDQVGFLDARGVGNVYVRHAVPRADLAEGVTGLDGVGLGATTVAGRRLVRV